MSSSMLWAAAQDVERIRAIWATHYGPHNGAKKRAVFFAAERWQVDEMQLTRFVSRSKKARQRLDTRLRTKLG